MGIRPGFDWSVHATVGVELNGAALRFFREPKPDDIGYKDQVGFAVGIYGCRKKAALWTMTHD